MGKFIIIFLFVFASTITNAQNFSVPSLMQPKYEAVIFNGNLPLKIDGDLSDWRKDSASKIELATSFQSRDLGQQGVLLGKEDLSASFRIVADLNYIYLAVEVSDNKKVFGESFKATGKWGDDDSVIIFLSGNSAISHKEDGINGIEIVFIPDQDGRIIIGGDVANLNLMPDSYRTMGVEAVLQEFDGGYTIEARIPSYLIDLEWLEIGRNIGFNIVVADDDDGKELDKSIAWTIRNAASNRLPPNPLGILTLNTQRAGIIQEQRHHTGVRSVIAEKIAEDHLHLTLTDQFSLPMVTTRLLTDDKALKNHFQNLMAVGENSPELVTIAGAFLTNSLKKWDDQALDALQILKVEAARRSSEALKKWVDNRQGMVAKWYVFAKTPHGITDKIVNESIRLFGIEKTQIAFRWTGIKNTSDRNYKKALDYQTQVLELDPAPIIAAHTYYEIGYNHKMLNEWPAAIKAFEKCVALESAVPPGHRKVAVAYYELGLGYLRTHDTEKAVQTWKKLLNRYNKDGQLYTRHKDNYVDRKMWFLPEALYHIVRLAKNRGNRQEFTLYFNKLKQEWPESHHFSKAQRMLELMD